MAEKIVLTAEQEGRAEKAINAFAKDSATTAKASDNMSKHVLSLAVLAVKAGGTLDRKVAVFGALTRHAETVFKQHHLKDGKELPIKALLPFWPVVKSQVLAGVKAEIDPSKVDSVYEMTRQLNAVTKPRAPGGNAGNDAGKITLQGELGKSFERLQAAMKIIVLKGSDADKAILASILNDAATKAEETSHILRDAEVKGGNNVPRASTVPQTQVA